jgi:hypothetical protein
MPPLLSQLDPVGVPEIHVVFAVAPCQSQIIRSHRLTPLQTVILPNTDAYEQVSKGKTFDLFTTRPNPAHEWYYCSDMRPDEGWLLKIFDSEGGKNGICGPAPHTSFELPGEVPKEARTSCEFRTLVFWD